MQSAVASAERVFELLDADEQSPDPADAQVLTAPARPRRVRARVVLLRARQAAHRGPVAGRRAGPDRRHRRPDRRRQDHPGQPGMRFYELTGGRITLDGVDITRTDPRRPALADRHGAAGHLAVRRHHPRQHRLRAPGRHRRRGAAGRAGDVRRPVRALAARRLRHRAGRRGRQPVSAGERQLITIARAFLADPALLILDEATSSVDTRTELLVQQAMAALRSDRTSFVIAHRLSTIRDADVILVMEDGAHRRAGQPRHAAGPRRRLRRAVRRAVQRGRGGRRRGPRPRWPR